MIDETTKHFFDRVAKIQKELKAPKNQFNEFGGYAYRSAEDILEALTDLLQGLVITINDEVVQIGDRYYVKATATITDGEKSLSTSAFAREPADRKGMDESQITGATSSYARKYALNGLLKIDDGKDPDVTNTHDKATAYQPTVSKQPEPQPQPVQQAAIGATDKPSPKQVALLDKLYKWGKVPKPGNSYSFAEARQVIDQYMKSINKSNG